MSFKELAEFLRTTSKEIHALQTEIGCVNASSYEASVMSTWQQLAESYRKQLESDKEDILHKCCAKWEEVSRRFALIGEHFVPRKTFEPPYTKRLTEAELELAAINSRLASREETKAGLSSHIDELCHEMKLERPVLPELLTDTAIEECRRIENELIAQKTQRLNEVQEYRSKIIEWSKYLGIDDQMQPGPDAIDSRSIKDLQKSCSQLEERWLYRKQEVETLEFQIKEIASLLSISPELPPTKEGAGTLHRIELLQQRLHELDILKVERIGELINGLRSQLTLLWEEIFLDLNLRTLFEDEPAGEEVYEKLRNRINELHESKNDPKRLAVVRRLSILKNVDEKEAKLSEMLQDPGRLTRAGFAGRLREEEKMRNYIAVNKNKTISTLQTLLDTWKQEHPYESFYIDGVEISERLAQEADKANLRRISINKKRPRPRSANAHTNSSLTIRRVRQPLPGGVQPRSQINDPSRRMLHPAPSMPALSSRQPMSLPSTIPSHSAPSSAPSLNSSLPPHSASRRNPQPPALSSALIRKRILNPAATSQSARLPVRQFPGRIGKQAPGNRVPGGRIGARQIISSSASISRAQGALSTAVSNFPTQQSTGNIHVQYRDINSATKALPLSIQRQRANLTSLRSANAGPLPLMSVDRNALNQPSRTQGPNQLKTRPAVSTQAAVSQSHSNASAKENSIVVQHKDEIEDSYFDGLHSSFYQQHQSFFDQTHDHA